MGIPSIFICWGQCLWITLYHNYAALLGLVFLGILFVSLQCKKTVICMRGSKFLGNTRKLIPLNNADSTVWDEINPVMIDFTSFQITYQFEYEI